MRLGSLDRPDCNSCQCPCAACARSRGLVAEASQRQQPRRANEAADDDVDDIPTNARPEKIQLSAAALAGSGLFHVCEAHGDTSKISALNVFNLPVRGGADLAYDLSADPAQVIADYRESPADPSLNLEGLLPLLQAAAAAPVEMPVLDAYLPQPSEADAALHRELEALIAEQRARVVRAIGALPACEALSTSICLAVCMR